MNYVSDIMLFSIVLTAIAFLGITWACHHTYREWKAESARLADTRFELAALGAQRKRGALRRGPCPYCEEDTYLRVDGKPHRRYHTEARCDVVQLRQAHAAPVNQPPALDGVGL